jgi:hypothetical protein
MVYLNSLRALIAAAALAIAVPALADTPAEVTVQASAQCQGLSGDEARRAAQQASRDGAHRKAAECFHAAGDHVRADRAQIRASADSGAAASRQASNDLDAAKEQARRIRAAFRQAAR